MARVESNTRVSCALEGVSVLSILAGPAVGLQTIVDGRYNDIGVEMRRIDDPFKTTIPQYDYGMCSE